MLQLLPSIPLNNCAVEWFLIFKEPRLGPDIVFHAAMPIQVIRRKIQQYCDAGSERIDGLQLK